MRQTWWQGGVVWRWTRVLSVVPAHAEPVPLRFAQERGGLLPGGRRRRAEVGPW